MTFASETISGPVKVYFVKNPMFDLVKLGNKITQMKKIEYNIVRPHQGLPLIHNTFLHLEKLQKTQFTCFENPRRGLVKPGQTSE
jgi:hypothetical protein